MKKDSVVFPGWAKGMNNIKDAHDLESDELRLALNVMLNKDGGPRLRPGRTKVLAGANVHSLYSCPLGVFFVDNGELKQLHSDYSTTTLRSDLDLSAPVSYDWVNDTVFYSNGLITGKIVNGVSSDWGLPIPPYPVVTQSATGSLPAGKYGVLLTYVDNTTGEEGGASRAVYTEITSNGLEITGIVQEAGYSVNVYCTTASGDTFFKVGNTTGASFTFTNLANQGKQLETRFGGPPEPGSIVRYFAGRMWVASGPGVFYSEPLRFGLFSPIQNFFAYARDVSIMQPADAGMFVVADKTYFYPATNPNETPQVAAYDHDGVRGTGLSMESQDLGLDEVTGKVAVWFSEKGLCIGTNGGQIIHAMERKVALEKYQSGATLFRAKDGIRQVVTAVKGGDGMRAALGATDHVSVTVKRNGVVIPA
jgi:hypothetical protein